MKGGFLEIVATEAELAAAVIDHEELLLLRIGAVAGAAPDHVVKQANSAIQAGSWNHGFGPSPRMGWVLGSYGVGLATLRGGVESSHKRASC